MKNHWNKLSEYSISLFITTFALQTLLIMLIAQKLRKENIAEYLLYMWQVEDLIRAKKLDIELIEETIVKEFDQSSEVKKEIREWYESLIDMMRQEDVKEKGHLAMNNNTIIQLTDLHLRLLKSGKHADYSTTYYKTLPYVVELRSKSGDMPVSEIETCFSALYGFLLIRMQNKDISRETQSAIVQISSFIRLLSIKFRLEQEHQLEL